MSLFTLFKKQKVPQFSPDEWILIFFYASPDKNLPKVNGILMLNKQFFVFVKEIRKDLDAVFKFAPLEFGPHSFVLMENINELIKRDLIKTYTNSIDKRTDFALSEMGIEQAKKLYEKLDNDTKIKLETLRNEANKSGYSGVLRYIYSRYPEYTTASKDKLKIAYG